MSGGDHVACAVRPWRIGILALALFFNGAAQADVLDVSADGRVVTYARAAAFNGPTSGVLSYPERGTFTQPEAAKSACRPENCKSEIKQILKGEMVNYSDGDRVCQANACYVLRGGRVIFDGLLHATSSAIPIAVPKAPPSVIAALLARAAARHAVDQRLLSAVAWRESHFQPRAVSPKGAVGVMQLMPETARALGVNQHDIAQNIEGGAAYLRQMLNRYDNNPALALAAYNAGPGAVDRYGTIPPFAETQAYVRGVLGDAGTWPRTAANAPER